MTKGSFRSHYPAIIVAGLLLAVIPNVLGDSKYLLRLAILAIVFMIYTVGFNIIFGHTAQLFLCLGALAGTSAFIAVVMGRELETPWWLALPIAALITGAIGALFSYISVRRGLGAIFLGIVTLAFSLVFQNVVLGLRKYTGGETGLVTRGMGPAAFENLLPSYYIFLGILLAALLVYHWLVSSRVGLAFQALKDDELTAELAGVNVTQYKVLAAAIGSGVIGVIGALHGYYNGFINPDVFSIPHIDVVVLVMLIFGGRATLIGPVLGGLVFAVVNELVRPLGALTLLVHGAVIVALFILFREGVVAAIVRLRRPQSL